MRAFVFSGMAFLLAIPALILAASLVSMLEIGSEGVFINVRGEKTFSLFESAEKDLDRAVDIAGRRAVIAAADYILTYDECLTPATYNTLYGEGAEGAIRELLITGNLTSVNHGVFSSLVMQESTLQDWIRKFSERAKALGFEVNITISPQDIYITPVNDTWYYVTLSMDALINDTATKRWIYNGTIPRGGNTTRLISGEGIGVSVFTCPEEEALNQPPNSTITYPGNGSSLSCNTTWINGTASDDGGVSQVWVIIDGGAEYGTANLTNPGGVTTDWYYSWTPSGDGVHTICSKAVDNEGLEQSPWYCIEVEVSGCPSLPPVCKLEYVPDSAGSFFSFVWFEVNNTDVQDVTVYNMTVWWSTQNRRMDRVWFDTQLVNSDCVANNTLVELSSPQTIASQDTAEILLRFRTDACRGFPDMGDTYFNVTFETDRGVCSVEFDT